LLRVGQELCPELHHEMMSLVSFMKRLRGYKKILLLLLPYVSTEIIWTEMYVMNSRKLVNMLSFDVENMNKSSYMLQGFKCRCWELTRIRIYCKEMFSSFGLDLSRFQNLASKNQAG
jgi:hypothetical protein